MRRNILRSVIILLCIIGLGGLLIFTTADTQELSKAIPVSVATPTRGTIERVVTYTGNLEADATVEIFANTSGKLVTLDVDDGARVNKGDILAQTDARELRLALKQAEASRKAAEAQLSTVKATAELMLQTQLRNASASLTAVSAQLQQAEALSEVEAKSAFHQAKTGVTAAETNLEKAKSGARNQEIEQANAGVSVAKAGLENAQASFARVEQLHKADAISDQDFDNAKAQLNTAEAQHKSAVEKLSLLEEGTRPEDIKAAEAQLDSAQAGFDLAQRGVETYETKITIAKTNVVQAEENLNSLQVRVDERVWEHDITAAEAQYEQAKQQVELAKKRLTDATITAPTDGIVVNRTADLGDYAAAAGSPSATPILTIVKVDVLKAVFSVPAAELSNIAVGTPIRLSMQDQDVVGKISFISPVVNPADRTVIVKAEIPNAEYQLKPGMFVEVNIDLPAPDDSLLLPREAVLNIQDGTGHVFVAKDGTAHKQTVKVGLAWGENISILKGITDSTSVIVSGHRQLADGADIHIVK